MDIKFLFMMMIFKRWMIGIGPQDGSVVKGTGCQS